MDLNCDNLETLESVCKKTFGPHGVAALIQNSSGFMSITRSGWSIVQSIFIENENQSLRLKYFLEDLKKLHHSLGDGVKTFVLLEFYLLKFLNKIKLENQLTNSKICHELQNLSNRLTEIIVPSKTNFPFENKEVCVKATSALFYTSCNLKTSSILENIFHDWFNLSLSITLTKEMNVTLISHLEFLIQNFHLFCFKNNVSKSVVDSYVLPGFVVNREALYLDKCDEQVHIVLYIPIQNADILDHSIDIKSLISEIPTYVENQIMLITSVILADSLLHDLNLQNIVVLQGVSKDDIEVISYFLSLNVHKSGNNMKVKLRLVGSKECTCFILPNIFQLCICAPTDALALEYIGICKRALIHLYAIAKCPFGYGLVKAGGIFERALCYHIARDLRKVNDPWIFNVHCRKDLLLWHHRNQVMKCKLPFNVSISNELKNKLTIQHTPPNTQIISAENSTSQSNTCQRESCSIGYILETLMECSESLIFPTFKNIDDGILVAFIQSLSIICNYLDNENSSDAVEHITIRISLLQHVINSVMVLFKCSENSVVFNT